MKRNYNEGCKTANTTLGKSA